MVKQTHIASESYRDQLRRLAQAMGMPRGENGVSSDLTPDSTTDLVKVFVDGNLDKRVDKLLKQLEFVDEAFDDLESLAIQYLREVPLHPYDSGTSDGERMLQWLEKNIALSAEQTDYVTCQRARHEVERLARLNRLKYLRFQERASLVDHHLEQLGQNASLQICLNPIRTWARFETGCLLDDESTPPADVLFLAIAGEITTAVLELEGKALLNELADYEPCTLAQWSALSPLAASTDLEELCTNLAGIGLIAFQ